MVAQLAQQIGMPEEMHDDDKVIGLILMWVTDRLNERSKQEDRTLKGAHEAVGVPEVIEAMAFYKDEIVRLVAQGQEKARTPEAESDRTESRQIMKAGLDLRRWLMSEMESEMKERMKKVV